MLRSQHPLELTQPAGLSWHPLCSQVWIFFHCCVKDLMQGPDAGSLYLAQATDHALTPQTDKQLSLSLMLLHLCCSSCNRPFLAASNLSLFTGKH